LKTLDSLVHKASGEIDAALGVEDIASRTDGLQAARAENGTVFGRAARRQFYKMMGAALLAIAGGLAVALGIITARSIFATLAGTTGLAIPLAIAGAIVFAAGASFLGVAVVNYNRVKSAWKSLDAKIDHSVLGRQDVHHNGA
jgi:hypothetical protein